ncbi:transketolase family protein [Eubacterium callanderi]|uniref:transketolase family protein n=1 Tax=Eubacterium callanderi TaxID=53442 RepID=UPI0022E8F6C0|nr:transketolase C-terminal domain-containing protein [Eubacterium callanderi]
MRDTFVKTLVELAKKNPNIELITGDLGFGVLKPFWEQLPDQFINAGIAEQNMTSVAAGMALEGKTVFTYSIGNFPTVRCLEQIRNDCAYHEANVKIVCVGGGFSYGALGMSHHATEDIALLRALPNVVVTAPGDLIEAKYVTEAIAKYPGTCYLRLGRGGEKQIHKNNIDNFKLGKAIKLMDGDKVAVFSTGAILDEAMKAVCELNNMGIKTALYSFPTIKPLDVDVIKDCLDKAELIVTVEENNLIGGFGSGILEVLAKGKRKSDVINIGIQDRYTSVVGDQQFLRKLNGLNSENIKKKILNYMGR